MKVWVVSLEESNGGCESCYSVSYTVEGVFSTKKRAEEYERKYSRSPGFTAVTECEIDKAVQVKP